MACASLEDDLEGYVNIRRANFRWRPLSLWNRNLQLHLRRKLSTFDIQNLRQGNNVFLVADFLNANANHSVKAWVHFFESPKIAFSELSTQSWWRAAETSRCRSVSAACAIVKHNGQYVAATAICWEGATLATYPPEDGFTDYCGHERIRAVCKEIRAQWVALNSGECRCKDCVLFHEAARFMSRSKDESQAGREKPSFGPEPRKGKKSTIKIDIAEPTPNKKTLFTTTTCSSAKSFVKYEPTRMVKNPEQIAKAPSLTGFLDLSAWGPVCGSTGVSTPVLYNAPDISAESVVHKLAEQQDTGSLSKTTPRSARRSPSNRAAGGNLDLLWKENDSPLTEQRDGQGHTFRSESPPMRSSASCANAQRSGPTAQTRKTPSPSTMSPRSQTRVRAAVPFDAKTTVDAFLEHPASLWDQDVTQRSTGPVASKDAKTKDSAMLLTTKQRCIAPASSASSSPKHSTIHGEEGGLQHSPQLSVRGYLVHPVREQQTRPQGAVLTRATISTAHAAPMRHTTILPSKKTAQPPHGIAAQQSRSGPVHASALLSGTTALRGVGRGVNLKTVASPKGASSAPPEMVAKVGSGSSATSSPCLTPEERASFCNRALRSSRNVENNDVEPGTQQHNLQREDDDLQRQLQQSPSHSTSFLVEALERRSTSTSVQFLPQSNQASSPFVVHDVFAPAIIRAPFSVGASESAERSVENVEGTSNHWGDDAVRSRMDESLEAGSRQGTRVLEADDENGVGMRVGGDTDENPMHFEAAAAQVQQFATKKTTSVDLIDVPPHLAPHEPPSSPAPDASKKLLDASGDMSFHAPVIHLHDAAHHADTSHTTMRDDATQHSAPIHRSTASSLDNIPSLSPRGALSSNRFIDSPPHVAHALHATRSGAGDAESIGVQSPSSQSFNVSDDAPTAGGFPKHLEEKTEMITLDQLSDFAGSVKSNVSSGTEERVIFNFPGAHHIHRTPLSEYFPFFTPRGTANGSFAQLAKAPLSVSPSNFVSISFLPATNPVSSAQHIDHLTSLLQLTPHANIDPLLCVFMPRADLTIAITPYRRSRTLLRTILCAPQITSQAWVADVFHQVIASVAYLHRQKLHICGSLHVGNIRIDHETNVVLCEAGWGNNQGMALCGPAEVTAPEVIQKTGHVLKSDTWTLGVLFYLLLTGLLPFGYLRGPERICEILAEETWSIPETDMDVVTTVSARKFATSMLNLRANNRPSVELCTQHPWTKSLNAQQQQNAQQGVSSATPPTTRAASGALKSKVIDRLRQYQAELDARKRAVEAVAAEMERTATRLDWLHRVCLADLPTALAERQFSSEACARVRAWTHSVKFRVDGTSGSSEFATWCTFLYDGRRSMRT